MIKKVALSLPASSRELLEKYEEYLREVRGYSQYTITMYSRKLRFFLERGYSANDLCGAVFMLIEKHSKGGDCYDQKDHGNTVSALKRLREYVFAPYADTFCVEYDFGWNSFSPKDQYVSGYTIKQGEFLVKYSKDFSLCGTKTFRVKDDDFYQLLKLFRDYRSYLSDSHTAIVNENHNSASRYAYTFGDRSACDCGCLFASKTPSDDRIANQATALYREWLQNYEPLAH